MPVYKFVAKDQNGKQFTGEVESLDEKSVVSMLRKEKLVPIQIKSASSEGFLAKISVWRPGGGVSTSDIVTFTRQLSTMISAGLPLIDALVILQRQTSGAFPKVLGEIVTDIEGGMSLSQAFSRHSKVFDVIYIKLIEAGETGGVLDKVLNKLAQSLEKDREFKGKTRGAFIYPAIVVCVMIIVMFLMMVFVIPKLTSLYTELGTQLPLPTKILILISNIMRNFWWLILIAIVGGIWGLRVFSKTPSGAQAMSVIVLKLPVWGKIRKTLVLAEFTRTLGLLVGTGIPIITALRVVRDILTSAAYKAGIDQAIARVERGSPLYQPLTSNPAFPPIVGQMVRVGEETGKMDEVLARLAVYFEGESENLIRNLTTALEPVVLVILGVGVGVLVLSIILPIYNLTSQF
ncbi:hypothetical protein A3B51_00320 [Candidatus Curtissbacteria bacterium RIFCSPLOWO2_01_FULL_41_18]|uniref:Type II secretion system protein GspF domain-containing protein n=2 Tax=Candidatus Curtissiibacteriota TaxID=1752717 RepID=A0A1F5FY96_9BACT|nr:MAG: hypothetical protein A2696_03975 [Candidatus Curtissbacteria bacterium RIFCSPHIGHO2_01_FULL_41_13]OGE04625.1 MAG: hypothetical protein A3B51_00320 [Candidatus Curtissbacteria bacterium RIFCSPLOWO2_01_FULL_41_18]